MKLHHARRARACRAGGAANSGRQGRRWEMRKRQRQTNDENGCDSGLVAVKRGCQTILWPSAFQATEYPFRPPLSASVQRRGCQIGCQAVNASVRYPPKPA
jgi:hypothetical protein